jgi:hypothetical protein
MAWCRSLTASQLATPATTPPTSAPWDDLVALVGHQDFLDVADSKLCTRAAMDHIHSASGRFVTVLPRTRREDGWFRDWITRHGPDWVEATRRPSRRRGQPDDVLSVFESPLGSVEGHRIITITESRDKSYTAEHRGNPGPNTRFRQTTRPRFTIIWRLRHHVIRNEAASNGCFPLITNHPNLDAADVLAAYRYQPHLEQRHHCLKGPQAVAPMNLHSPAL